jgi:DNA-binding HxlR family transcriptional regulator
MRSYGQYCAVAKALDVVGDRWTLLIVRELLLRGACRYTDLRAGLPGIATNLLAERLRELERAGIVRRHELPPPAASTVFELSPRGAALAPVLDELGRWGVPYMAEGPAPADAFRGHWLAWPVEAFLEDRDPHGRPLQIAVSVAGEQLTLSAENGEVHLRPGHPEQPDGRLEGDPHAILGVLSGKLDLDRARERGLRYEGETAALERLLPAAG